MFNNKKIVNLGCLLAMTIVPACAVSCYEGNKVIIDNFDRITFANKDSKMNIYIEADIKNDYGNPIYGNNLNPEKDYKEKNLKFSGFNQLILQKIINKIENGLNTFNETVKIDEVFSDIEIKLSLSRGEDQDKNYSPNSFITLFKTDKENFKTLKNQGNAIIIANVLKYIYENCFPESITIPEDVVKVFMMKIKNIDLKTYDSINWPIGKEEEEEDFSDSIFIPTYKIDGIFDFSDYKVNINNDSTFTLLSNPQFNNAKKELLEEEFDVSITMSNEVEGQYLSNIDNFFINIQANDSNKKINDYMNKISMKINVITPQLSPIFVDTILSEDNFVVDSARNNFGSGIIKTLNKIKLSEGFNLPEYIENIIIYKEVGGSEELFIDNYNREVNPLRSYNPINLGINIKQSFIDKYIIINREGEVLNASDYQEGIFTLTVDGIGQEV